MFLNPNPKPASRFTRLSFSRALALTGIVLAAASCALVAGETPPKHVVLAPPPATFLPPADAAKPPSPALALSRKGERAYLQEDYDAAERFFRDALRIEPGALHALTGMGWTLYDDGRPKGALPFFLKARKLHPNDGSAQRGLGYLYYRSGDKEKARQMLGSLDKEKWPELANIDAELRRKKTTPPAKTAPSQAGSAPPKEARAIPSPPKPASRKMAAPALALRPSYANMVEVPGGHYEMGIVAEPPEKNEKKKRRRRGKAEQKTEKKKGIPVVVKPFRLDRFEVTNAMYARFVRETGHPAPPFWERPHFHGEHIPVVGVSWHEARAYCAWAGKRLPAEKEWEFAAKGGAMGRPYPWGSKLEDRNAVYGLPPDRGGPKAVGRRPEGASPYGAEDMAGNVWEWVEDTFRARLEDSQPIVRGGKAYRTLRGGSWVNSSRELATIARTGDVPGRRLPVYGFRCAANAP
ncbi:MAG: SUMF1/EgtB/PvdO family nonheme iron enzyme [bacterium]|nr:SUMF1/EgtB/PvdO family nonheme iron enzyme [bacterium]